jgi:spermidine/putrescine transport system permease protein
LLTLCLYANEWETFRRVTFPLVAPGIAAAALLAFALSFDDFIITNFNSGTLNTFPEYVWTASLRGVPPQANVIGTLMFVIALAIVFAGQVISKRRQTRR